MSDKSFVERHSEALKLEAEKSKERLVGLRGVKKVLKRTMTCKSYELDSLKRECVAINRKIDQEKLAVKEYEKWAKKVLKAKG